MSDISHVYVICKNDKISAIMSNKTKANIAIETYKNTDKEDKIKLTLNKVRLDQIFDVKIDNIEV